MSWLIEAVFYRDKLIHFADDEENLSYAITPAENPSLSGSIKSSEKSKENLIEILKTLDEFKKGKTIG